LPNQGAAFRSNSGSGSIGSTTRSRISNNHPLKPSESSVGWIQGGGTFSSSSSATSLEGSGQQERWSSTSADSVRSTGSAGSGSGLRMPTPLKNGKMIR
jgi:hypothetical protein